MGGMAGLASPSAYKNGGVPGQNFTGGHFFTTTTANNSPLSANASSSLPHPSSLTTQPGFGHVSQQPTYNVGVPTGGYAYPQQVPPPLPFLPNFTIFLCLVTKYNCRWHGGVNSLTILAGNLRPTPPPPPLPPPPGAATVPLS
jgi:hypothetical protein